MGNLVFQATLGGQVNLVGPNTASTFNLNVPAVSSTIATTSGTETLTNKTLTSPVISGGTIDNAVIGGTTAAAGSFTTLSASSTLSVTGAGTIQGLTVGKGAGAVASNTAVGASALATNSVGTSLTAIGSSALNAATGSDSTGVGFWALKNTSTGVSNTALGSAAAYQNTTGSYNTALGKDALQANTTASNNTAVGYQAAYSFASTGTSPITAVGALAAYSINAADPRLTAIGYQALYSNNGGGTYENTAVGWYAARLTTTGSGLVAMGNESLSANTTGSNIVAIGYQALASNTIGAQNTAVGYRAGFSNVSSNNSVFFGDRAGYSNTGAQNTFIGQYSGYSATSGTYNTFVGNSAGNAITTGGKNTILGAYSGNQGGLDIRTASNKVVLSDGDGSPVFVYGAYPYTGGTYLSNSSYATLGRGGTGSTGTGALFLSGEASSGWGPFLAGFANSSGVWYLGSNSWIKGGTAYDTFTVAAGAGASGGVNLTAGATSWASASDARLKNITGTYSNALADIAQIEAVKFTWKADEEAKPCVGVIAQSVQSVVPEAIETIRVNKDDETDYLSVKYTELIPLMIASIQALKAEIDTLKGQA